MKNTETKFIAHGGFSARYPENTLTSYLEAAKLGAKCIEGDVVLHPETGELICFHPSGISSGAGTYDAQTIAQQINQGQEFPTLAEVLLQLPEDVRFLVDFKQPSEIAFETLLQDRDIDISRVIIGVRNMADFQLIRKMNQQVEMLALFSDPDSFVAFQAAGGKYFRLWEKDVTPERVEAIQKIGLEVWVTPGKKATPEDPVRTAGETDAAHIQWLMNLYVNAVLVNDISLAMSVKE